MKVCRHDRRIPDVTQIRACQMGMRMNTVENGKPGAVSRAAKMRMSKAVRVSDMPAAMTTMPAAPMTAAAPVAAAAPTQRHA
jgi:hypothetical protein